MIVPTMAAGYLAEGMNRKKEEKPSSLDNIAQLSMKNPVKHWLSTCAGFFRLAQAMELDALGTLLRAWIKVPARNDLSILVRVIREVLFLPEVAEYYEWRGKSVENVSHQLADIVRD
jgi:hypothetical protein